jgi:hypothetical protein
LSSRTGENTATVTYDAIRQVVGDVAAEGTTNRLNEQLEYGFDPAGNLINRTNNTLVENFQVNSSEGSDHSDSAEKPPVFKNH